MISTSSIEAKTIEEIQKLAISMKEEGSHKEEGTKIALVQPFIRALGYDPENPSEVQPEYPADSGSCDYVIKDCDTGSPFILLECKPATTELKKENVDQLAQYFHKITSDTAKIAILTNGIIYQFYTDLDRENLMDKTPFSKIDLNTEIGDNEKEILGLFVKESFDLEKVRDEALKKKYIREIKEYLHNQYKDPCKVFIKFMASKVYNGNMTEKKRTEFIPLIKKAIQGFIDDEDRSQHNAKGIVTTIEEKQAYDLVKALLKENIDQNRIRMRDYKGHCSVLLDDNQQKQICQFFFDEKGKELGIIEKPGGKQNVKKIEIESFYDIGNYKDDLTNTLKGLLNE